MAINTESKEGVVICRIDGKIDINSIPEIRKVFEGLVGKKEPKVLVSFSKVAHIDSSGMGLLVDMLKNMKAYGGLIKLSGLSARIKTLFKITNLEKIFQIFDEESGAVGSFK